MVVLICFQWIFGGRCVWIGLVLWSKISEKKLNIHGVVSKKPLKIDKKLILMYLWYFGYFWGYARVFRGNIPVHPSNSDQELSSQTVLTELLPILMAQGPIKVPNFGQKCWCAQGAANLRRFLSPKHPESCAAILYCVLGTWKSPSHLLETEIGLK